jgi:hypothetical protein
MLSGTLGGVFVIRIVTAIVALLAGSAQALACRVPYIRTFDNQTVSGQTLPNRASLAASCWGIRAGRC